MRVGWYRREVEKVYCCLLMFKDRKLEWRRSDVCGQETKGSEHILSGAPAF
jgi:hypothetical protein